MTDEPRITHRIGILELPDGHPILKRMLQFAHGPEKAEAFLAAVEGARFVVMCHPDPLGAGFFSTNSLDDVLSFFGELWRRSCREGGEFHYVVNASPDVRARVDLHAMETMGSLPRTTGSGF
jgi:hypothetical protein